MVQCSFCGLSQEESDKKKRIMVTNTNANATICFECIATCGKLMVLFPEKKIIPYIKAVKIGD